mgnify:CR=1 FL=1
MSFKLTYASMFNPPADMHTRFESALSEVKAGLGATHELFIDGRDVPAKAHDARKSPIDQRMVTGRFPLATAEDANNAMAAAAKAAPAWRNTPVAERVRLLKKVARLIEERLVSHVAPVGGHEPHHAPLHPGCDGAVERRRQVVGRVHRSEARSRPIPSDG